MDALARKLQPLPPIIHRKINLERKANCKINLERKANCKIKLIMSLFFGNAPTLGAFLKKGLSRLNINGPIGVQNLFCEGPIGVQNLFCEGPIGVQNLFCEGPIGVQNLFNLSTLAPGIELLSEGAISILLIGHNKKYNRTISINLF